MVLVNSVLSHVFVMVTHCLNTSIKLMVKNTVRLCVVMVWRETKNNVMMATLSMVTDVHPLVRSKQLGVATTILSTLVALWKAHNSHSPSTRSSKYPTRTPWLWFCKSVLNCQSWHLRTCNSLSLWQSSMSLFTMSQESQNPIKSSKSPTITISQYMARKAVLGLRSVSTKTMLHRVWYEHPRTSPSWLKPTTTYPSCFTLKKNSTNNKMSHNQPMCWKSSLLSYFSCRWFLPKSSVCSWSVSCSWLTLLSLNKTTSTSCWNLSWRWTKSTVSMLTGWQKTNNCLIKSHHWVSTHCSSTTVMSCYSWLWLK